MISADDTPDRASASAMARVNPGMNTSNPTQLTRGSGPEHPSSVRMSLMSGSVIETFPLGMPWQTFDPFLFCVHHQDDYPAGTSDLAPQVPLTGRNIGSDFSGLDGWSMYHGTHIPGFPQHPHRGFETISFVRSGYMDHADSLGASARFGAGDVQWMTAGAGIVHSEMFPLLESEAPNPVELFQIWINLPAEDKLVPPHFKMLWNADIPRVEERDSNGHTAEITVIAGEINGLSPPSPPPHSWASQAENDVAIWHVRLEADARWVLPVAAAGDTVRSVYVQDGGPVGFDGEPIADGTGAVVRSD